jgi:hypothetical protein
MPSCCRLAAGLRGPGWSPARARRAQEVIDREYEIKAAYLYHFALYVDWPKEAAQGADKIVIAVWGRDPIDEHLKRLEEKKIHGKPVEVVRFKDLKDVALCHVLFIPDAPSAGADVRAARDRLAAALGKTKNTLLVTEASGLTNEGAMINYYVEDNRVRFEINPQAARRAGLQVSSKLLKLGRIVSEE